MGCKGWGDHRDSHAVSVQVMGSIERSVFLLTAAVSLAAEENGVTVTNIRSATPGKRKTKAR